MFALPLEQPRGLIRRTRGCCSALMIRPYRLGLGVSSSRRTTVLRNFARGLVGCPATTSLWIAAAGCARGASATRLGLATALARGRGRAGPLLAAGSLALGHTRPCGCGQKNRREKGYILHHSFSMLLLRAHNINRGQTFRRSHAILAYPLIRTHRSF
jgi:hypothetical protein